MKQPPLLGLAGFSGSGKTTLLVELARNLSHQGLSIAALKHTHHSIRIDRPGKDSHRFRSAGAEQVVVSSSRRRVWLGSGVPASDDLESMLKKLPTAGVDLVLIEGFKHAAFPRIEIHRPVLGHPLLAPTHPEIIAVASDESLLARCTQPILPLNDTDHIARFIIHWMQAAA